LISIFLGSYSNSRWNKGLTDRIITTRQSLDTQQNVSGSLSLEETYNENLKKLFIFRAKMNDGTISIEDINNNKQSVIDLFKYEIGYYTETQKIPGIGFIPINLQLNMDGLSGIKIYEAYSINDTLLPQNYRDNIQFITIGVSDKIDNNGWTTTLESLSGPKPNNSASLSESTNQVRLSKSTTNIKKAEEALSVSSQINTNAEKLREVLKELGYTENGKEIDSSGNDITEELYLASSDTLRNIKINAPDLDIRITGGNDFFHKKRAGYHPKGKALDFVVSGVEFKSKYDGDELLILDGMVRILEGMKNQIPGFGYLDEYRFPSKAATSGHFHIYIDSREQSLRCPRQWSLIYLLD